ncbi:DEAD/DEAH box helicase [Salsuginibacillus kocurii]|uniref:DEAD/DEAH box helicase n=1 Tax=Salsuginibacillus kocurii TaxID=427078 RepID=UPI00036E58BD|nr:DEAD/DEAH box helicase [Salsuginibacillus kocurii]
MFGKHSFENLINELAAEPQVVHWEEVPSKEAVYASFPASLDARLHASLQTRGISSLYTHQRDAYDFIQGGKNIVAVTPTASGKTLCYNLPVVNDIVNDASARALYLFPTKALAQDQKNELNEWIEQLNIPINSYTYDGDTQPAIRQKIRKAGHIVITNPDMLHSAILPHHTKWVSLFENLKYIVIDELHTYRGVFGSHVANVIRRLKRLAAYYGSDPQFITTSATIANPKELAETLTGKEITLVDNNGAPRGKKHFAIYNPPVVHSQMNIRRSASKDSTYLAERFLKEGIQTIVFAKSRVRVEVILSHLQELVKKEFGQKSIQAYRGGYLPGERRNIEKGLRNGSVKGVVSTNALELGMDIGQLQVCVMTGYPGSIASTWQQAGRAGRRNEESLVVMVAGAAPIDQYMTQHPEYFFSASPEHARIHPDNLVILVDHLKCAAYELPFTEEESFGEEEISEILDFLNEEGVLHKRAGKWYWMDQAFPAHNVSLRSASQENVVIVDQTVPANVQIIGEMDRFSAMTLLHEEAIYLHQGTQFQVEELDWEEKKAYVKEVDVEYFTDANLNVRLYVLDIDQYREMGKHAAGFGDVAVTIMPSLFKKLKLSTYETIGSGPIHLPQEEIHTQASWLELDDEMLYTDGHDTFEKALLGISLLFEHLVPVFTLSDRSDVHVAYQVKADHSERPTIFLYDHYPGGIGLAKQLYAHIEELIAESIELLHACACSRGCPSCVGYDEFEDMKGLVLKLLQSIRP